jgi:hypothetical protein
VTNLGLETLERCPENVPGTFECENNTALTTLVGGPKVVGGHYRCSKTGIVNLVGAPEVVGINFNCTNCKNLISLEGLPKKIGNFVCPSNLPIQEYQRIFHCDVEDIFIGYKGHPLMILFKEYLWIPKEERPRHIITFMRRLREIGK